MKNKSNAIYTSRSVTTKSRATMSCLYEVIKKEFNDVKLTYRRDSNPYKENICKIFLRSS